MRLTFFLQDTPYSVIENEKHPLFKVNVNDAIYCMSEKHSLLMLFEHGCLIGHVASDPPPPHRHPTANPCIHMCKWNMMY